MWESDEEGSDTEDFRNLMQHIGDPEDDWESPYGADLFFNVVGQAGLFLGDDDLGYEMAAFHDFLDYDTDNDDYDDYDDDFSDGFLDDDGESEEQKARRFFVSLQDSHVIGRLSFHKDLAGEFRLPRVVEQSRECYEDLYRLLEEVELLARVWKARLDHPYTAHLRDRGEAGQAAALVGEENLVEGEDYLHSDYERDGSFEELYLGSAAPKVTANETLTKKKYCQSVRIYHQIFDSDKKFDSFLRSLVLMKKAIFQLIFQLFLEVLPPATVSRLPGELWEKIWKHTQNEYFTSASSQPLAKDKSYFKAGLRADSQIPHLSTIEQERLNELFGAVGNIHIILFEILYKSRGIVLGRGSPLQELEQHAQQGAQYRRIRSVWWRHSSNLVRKFSRFKHLDYLLNSSQSEESQPGAGPACSSLLQKLETGAYVIRSLPCAAVSFPLAPLSGGNRAGSGRSGSSSSQTEREAGLYRPPLQPASEQATEQQQQQQEGRRLVAQELASLHVASATSIIVSSLECDLVALPGYCEVNNQPFLAITLVEVNSGKILYVVKTAVKYNAFQMSVAVSAVRWPDLWKRQFYLTRDRLSFLYCDNQSRQPETSVQLWTTALPRSAGESCTVLEIAGPLLVETVSLDPTVIPATSTCLAHHTQDRLILSAWSQSESVLNVYEAEGGEQLLNIEFPGEEVVLVSSRGNRALLLNRSTRCLHYFSTDSGESITTYASSLKNEGSASTGFEIWSGIFSSSSGSEEFVLWNSSLSQMKLFSYNPRDEVAVPELILTADFTETVTAETMCSAKLADGVVFFNRASYKTPSLHTADLIGHEVCAFSLRSQCCHSLVTMPLRKDAASQLNELSFRHLDLIVTAGLGYFPQRVEPLSRPLFVAGPLRLGLLLESADFFKIFDFTVDERSEVEAELAIHKQVQEAREQKATTKRGQLDRYLDKEERLLGQVKEWRGTYGFIRCRGNERALGRIFFHRSDLEGGGRKHNQPAIGDDLQFNLVPGRDPGTLRAIKVTFRKV